MGVKVTIGIPQRQQVVTQQLEVQRLFLHHAQPVAVVRVRHVCKPPDGIRGQVNSVELDMRQ